MVRARRVLLASAGLLAALLGMVTACGDPFPHAFVPPTVPTMQPYALYSTDNPLVPPPTSAPAPPTAATAASPLIPSTARVLGTIQVTGTTAPATAVTTTAACGGGFVRDPAGRCVFPLPPTGAVARCADGTYSITRHRRDACAGHGGVVRWL